MLISGPTGIQIGCFIRDRPSMQLFSKLDSPLWAVFSCWIEATLLFFCRTFLEHKICSVRSCTKLIMVHLRFYGSMCFTQDTIDCPFLGFSFLLRSTFIFSGGGTLLPKKRISSPYSRHSFSVYHWKERFFFVKHPINDWRFEWWGVHSHRVILPPTFKQGEQVIWNSSLLWGT